MDTVADDLHISTCSSDLKKNDLFKSWSWCPDGVIDLQDRIAEDYRRPRERFERKFQDYLPEYNICLPRAPAFRVVSAKKAGEISERLYSHSATRLSRTRDATHFHDVIVRRQHSASLHGTSTSTPEGVDTYNLDESDKLKAAKVQLFASTRSTTRNAVFGNKLCTVEETLTKDTNNKDKNKRRDNWDMTTTKLKSKETKTRDKFPQKDTACINTLTGNEINTTQNTTKDKVLKNTNYAHSNNKDAKSACNETKHKKLTLDSAASDNIHKYDSFTNIDKFDSADLMVNISDGSSNRNNTGVVSCGNIGINERNKEDIHNTRPTHTEPLFKKSKTRGLTLLRAIVEQSYEKTIPEENYKKIVSEEENTVRKLEYKDINDKPRTYSESTPCCTLTMNSVCEEENQRLKSPLETKESPDYIPASVTKRTPPFHNKVRSQILNRPKMNVKLELTGNENMNMLIYQLALTSKKCQIPPSRLLQTLFGSPGESEHRMKTSSENHIKNKYTKKFVRDSPKDQNHKRTPNSNLFKNTEIETSEKPFPKGRDMILLNKSTHDEL